MSATILRIKCTIQPETPSKLLFTFFCDSLTAVNTSVSITYFAVSAPLVIRVLISSSWPYRAAMCKGVFPFLSSQSITAPAIKDIMSDT